MATAERPNLNLVPPLKEPEPRSPSLRNKLLGTAGAVLAVGAVVMPSPYTLQVKNAAEHSVRAGDVPAEVADPNLVTTALREGETPWETAARDLADARDNDPVPTADQTLRATQLLEDKNNWISAEQAEPGRIAGLTPDETASILDNRPIERTQ